MTKKGIVLGHNLTDEEEELDVLDVEDLHVVGRLADENEELDVLDIECLHGDDGGLDDEVGDDHGHVHGPSLATPEGELTQRGPVPGPVPLMLIMMMMTVTVSYTHLRAHET